MVSQPHPHSTLVPPIAFSLQCRATSVKWVSTYCSKQCTYLCLVSEIGHFWNFLHNLGFVRTWWLIRSEPAGMHQFQQFLGWKGWLKNRQTVRPGSHFSQCWSPHLALARQDVNTIVLGSCVTSGCFTQNLTALGFIPAQSRKNFMISCFSRCYRGWEDSFLSYTIWRSAVCVLGLFSNYTNILALFSFYFKCKSRLGLFPGFCYH